MNALEEILNKDTEKQTYIENILEFASDEGYGDVGCQIAAEHYKRMIDTLNTLHKYLVKTGASVELINKVIGAIKER